MKSRNLMFLHDRAGNVIQSSTSITHWKDGTPVDPERRAYQGTFTSQVREVRDDESEIVATVSTGSIDRHRTIFLPSVWDRALPPYMSKNPILLWGHKWDGEPEDALGNAVEAEGHENGLDVRFHYDVDVNPKAKLVFNLVKSRTLRAYSIGCYINESVTRKSPNDDIMALPDFAREALVRGECDEVFTDIELVEISQVLLGSNRDALAHYGVRLVEGRLEEIPEGERREGKAISLENARRLRCMRDAMNTMDQHLGDMEDQIDEETDAALSGNDETGDAVATESDEGGGAMGENDQSMGARPRHIKGVVSRVIPAGENRAPIKYLALADRLCGLGSLMYQAEWYDSSQEEICQTLGEMYEEIADIADKIRAMYEDNLPEVAEQDLHGDTDEDNSLVPGEYPTSAPAEDSTTASAEDDEDDFEAFSDAMKMFAKENPAGALALLNG